MPLFPSLKVHKVSCLTIYYI